MDASEIPFPDSCMGTVIMNNLMHHLPNRSAILNEVLRVLKKGGKFIFTDCKIGWGIFTWEQILLRKLNLHRLAESMLRFKLQLSAQRLLIDDCYYDKKSKSRNFRILKKINFISRTSMYLGSVFEFLNLKMGQPTREEMVRWINFFGLEGKISRYVKNIIEYCCIMDKRLGEKEGYTIQFIKIEKLRENELNMGYNSGPIAYVCPKCKKSLAKTNDSFFCSHCDSNFPIIDGIPILISYQDKLRGFASYIERTGREKTKEYVT